MTKQTGTCQICAGTFRADSGTIKRHGWNAINVKHGQNCGFHNGICHGAGSLPFEISRDALGAWIPMLRASAQNLRDVAAPASRAGREGLRLSAGSGLKVLREGATITIFATSYKLGENIELEVDRLRVPMVLIQHGRAGETLERVYADACERLARAQEAEAARLESEADRQQARFDSWAPGSLVSLALEVAKPAVDVKTRRAAGWNGEWLAYPVDVDGRKCGPTEHTTRQGLAAAVARLRAQYGLGAGQ
jgi:hypothetical protein